MCGKKYDFVCSLGGNCMAAHNLRCRGLRYYSLPFDWCYIENAEPLKVLAECFKNGDFSKFFLKENLVEKGFNSFHHNRIQYQDSYSGYIFANHFVKKIEEGSYEPVKRTFDRRIKRLVSLVQNCESGLFIVSTIFEYDIGVITGFYNVLKEKYPDKKFDFEVIMFGCNKTENIVIEDCINIHKYERPGNIYDYMETNFEWNFMDKISINRKIPFGESRFSKLLEFRINHGIKLIIFPLVEKLVDLRLYILGLKFYFIIGREKD